ncbi:MAG: hypothetical protein M3O67_03765, partial [Bacteroidota bacterium]|nr:hypothetical protein [Bacteroidota bacterium]
DTASPIAKDELSITQEMGKLYNSMLDALEDFGIRRIIINNAKLSLINTMNPGTEPVTISHIYFDLQRTATKTNRRDEFVNNEQSVELRTANQDIALPGGRHRLSFKKFHLELFEKRIELDSCTVTAIAKDSAKSSYTIFFNKLLLIGVDFGAMYHQNIIRADSVYCENPLFDININTSVSQTKKTERPDADKIVRELTGDLDLAFVGVKDAGIHINLTGKKKRSLFNSNKDDFEMHGLRINGDSSKPVVVNRFDMLVRDYHLYNEDSSAAYTFDSIHFVNNKIILNNFSVVTASTQNKLRNQRDFKIPFFELTGLDWYQLIFNETFKAQEAVLYNPVINFRKIKPASRKKTNMFAALHNIDDLVALNKITVINGQLNMSLGPAASFNLQNANLRLYIDKLLQSKNNEGLLRAIDLLSFSNGTIRLKDITAQLQNVRSGSSNLIHADKITVTSSTNKTNASIDDVYIDNLLLSDDAENIVVDGVRWKNAKIVMQSSPVVKNKKSATIHLKNISGNNTQLSFFYGNTAISTFVQSLKLSSVNKNGKGPLHIEGLFLAGNNLSFKNGGMQVKTAGYQVAEEAPSFITQVQIERIQQRDSLSLKSPRINFNADINGMLEGNIHLTNVQLQSPIIKVRKWNTDLTQDTNTQKTFIHIDRLIANEPDIYISTHRNDSTSIINIPRSDNSLVKVSGLVINNKEIQLSSLSVNTNSATLIQATGETYG